MRAIEWPYEEDKDSSPSLPGNERKSMSPTGEIERQRDIANYLADNKFDLVINLAMRDGGSRPASSFITQVSFSLSLYTVGFSSPAHFTLKLHITNVFV